jgi:hypothetical protein
MQEKESNKREAVQSYSYWGKVEEWLIPRSLSLLTRGGQMEMEIIISSLFILARRGVPSPSFKA